MQASKPSFRRRKIHEYLQQCRLKNILKDREKDETKTTYVLANNVWLAGLKTFKSLFQSATPNFFFNCTVILHSVIEIKSGHLRDKSVMYSERKSNCDVF